MHAASRAVARSTTTALLRSSPPAGPSSSASASASRQRFAVATAAAHPRGGRCALQVQAGRGFSELLSLREDKKK